MQQLRRAVTTVSAMALVITGAAMVSTAEAAPHSPGAPHAQVVSACGTVIATPGTYVLATNIGPCTGDGIKITADRVTLDLGGHTVTGSNTTEVNAQQIGTHLLDVRDVTVRNGTVQHFDAGVALEGGSHNTVTGLTVQDNVNHSIFTGVQSRTDYCDYGDGITVDNSSNNTFTGNTVLRNGPFSGIALVDNSDHNTVTNNQVLDQNVENRGPVTPLEPSGGTLCGAGGSTGGPGGTGPMPTGRPVQDEGIRVEGPGADNNTVANNLVRNASLYGIGIHPYACHFPPGSPTGQPNNGGNVVRSNAVYNTGLTTHNDDPVATGIGIFENGPSSVVCASSGNTIQSNTSNGNFQDGIQVGGRGAHNNKVLNNTAIGNHNDGISLVGPEGPAGATNDMVVHNVALNNGRFDGADFTFTPPCDNNKWAANRFQTVNQPCVAAHGGSGTVTTP